MQSEMLAILTAYFLYYGDASWVFWLFWVLTCCSYVWLSIGRAKENLEKEIEEQRIYWEGK